jgi:cellobiose-specific phosphotransferase system component IIA
MRKATLMCATAMSVLAVGVTPALSAGSSADVTRTSKTEVTSPSAEMNHLAARKMFLTDLHHAQLAMQNKDKGGAEKHISAAIHKLKTVGGTDSSEAKGIIPKAKETAEEIVEKIDPTTEVEGTTMSSNLFDERKVISLEVEGNVEPDDLVYPVSGTGQDFSKVMTDSNLDGKKLEGAKVRYIALKVDAGSADAKLKQALNEIKSDNYSDAEDQIEDVQEAFLEEREQIIPAKLRAKDNISLTRLMVQKAQYEAARDSLEEAQDALAVLKDKKDSRAAVESIQSEFKALEKQIAQQDPNLLDKIDTTLEKWWNSLS